MRKDSLNQENFSEYKKEEKKNNVNKNSKEDKKNEKEEEFFKEEIFDDKENELEKELISLINLNYGDKLLLEINFELLLTRLMEIIYNFIKKSDSDYEERQIVCTSINLWSLIIISQENIPRILNFVYDINLSENIDFEIFVLRGILYSNNIFLRLSFFKNLKSLTKNLYQSGEYSLLLKLLNLFMNKYFDFNKKEKLNWKFFYTLFEYLLETGLTNDIIKNKISKIYN